MNSIRSVLRVVVIIFLLLHSQALISFAGSGKFKVIHVAKSGSDENTGSKKSPFLTITKAESIAQPGDSIIVHKGTYREMIVLHTGGVSDSEKITYQAAKGEEVIIKGSERIQSWIHSFGNCWKTVIDEKLFNGFNPFTKYINKDSSFEHLAAVYINNLPLKEERLQSQIDKTEGSWITMQENDKIILIANFGKKDPNINITEINVRPNCFSALHKGVNYITIDGFKITQIASPMASIDGEQPGAISTNGASHWLIQNCSFSDCKSVAISIGQTGHSYPGANPGKPQYNDLSQNINFVGHHIIRHNHIFRCGQAGVFGLLHGTMSEIADNLIEDINSTNSYPSDDIAGIRLALAVDVQITHNLIRRIKGISSGYGIFIGPLFQGAYIQRNTISDISHDCIFLFNSHGPALFSNNILCGSGKKTGDGIKMLSAEANVFVQNLFYGCAFSNNVVPGKSFATSNFLPHSLVIKQTIPALPIDDRWYRNLFIKIGLDQLPGNADCLSDYNVFLDGAALSSWGDKHSKVNIAKTNFKMVKSLNGVNLYFDGSLIPSMTSPTLSHTLIGFFTLSKQYVEYPDGRPITIDCDFNKVTVTNKSSILAGPFYKYLTNTKSGQILFTY